MTADTIKLFSTIRPALLRAALFKGTFFAGLGVLLLLFVTTYLSHEVMISWGLLFLFVGGTLMIYGLIPYRRLCRMESMPAELVVCEDEYLQLFIFGKLQYTIPLSIIEKMDYIEDQSQYGIGLFFSAVVEEKAIVHNRALKIDQLIKKSRQTMGCDLFIPYFGRRAFMRLALLRP